MRLSLKILLATTVATLSTTSTLTRAAEFHIESLDEAVRSACFTFAAEHPGAVRNPFVLDDPKLFSAQRGRLIVIWDKENLASARGRVLCELEYIVQEDISVVERQTVKASFDTRAVAEVQLRAEGGWKVLLTPPDAEDPLYSVIKAQKTIVIKK